MINRRLFLWVLSLIGSMTYLSGQSFPEPLSDRTASYDMDIELDVENKQVKGTQTLIFTNPSADTIKTMQFHMYYNAWKNNLTDFMTENGRIPRTKSEEEIENCEWSWIEVFEIKDSFGNDLSQKMAYIQPDDDNIYDQTVLEVELEVPVLPYQTYELDMKWASQIPHLMIRTGYSRDYFFMVQWYPKLGVYEAAGTRFAEEGQWNCHQYHAATEYFGEYGVYNVNLTVPTDHIVGASGFLVNKEEKGKVTTHTYLAEDVIDFAWTAHPGFVVIEDHWEDVDIRLLIRPEHSCTADRFMKAAKSTFSFYKEYLGESYPYPNLTIVAPPFYGLNSGAMEYPTLITVPTMCDFPSGIKTTETLTIHELTHQFFMQIVGSNEQEEPWLDEGFTSYFEAKILDQAFPEGTVSWPYMRMNVGSEELRRGRFFNADNIKVNPISDFGWQFKHGSYSQIVYGKTAVCLRTLEGLVGEENMKTIIRTYYQRWKFKHPYRQDFIDVVNEIVDQKYDEEYAQNVKSFWQQAVYGTEECDYAIHSLDNTPKKIPLGYLKNTEDCLDDTTVNEKLFDTKIVLFRLGELIVPQEILVTFDNGEQTLEKWDGKARSYELNYSGHRKAVSVHIDPELKTPIDRNLINNSFILEQNEPGITRYFISFLSWLQSIMVSMTALV